MNKIVISHPLYQGGMEMLEGKAELIFPNNGDSDQIIDDLVAVTVVGKDQLCFSFEHLHAALVKRMRDNNLVHAFSSSAFFLATDVYKRPAC